MTLKTAPSFRHSQDTAFTSHQYHYTICHIIICSGASALHTASLRKLPSLEGDKSVIINFSMSPRKRRLRDRTKLHPPSRFKDEGCIKTPSRQGSYEESRQSSDLEEEIYESPKPKKRRKSAYRGEVTEFNPSVPPAAFPTLDHPDYVHNGGNIAIDLLSGLQSCEPKDNAVASGRGFLPEVIDLTEHQIMTSTSADSARRGSGNVEQTPMTVEEQSQGTVLWSTHGEVTDNGPQNPLWTSNMARMAAAGMSDLDKLMLEMETSDEENAAASPTERARMVDITEIPAWDDLTIAHKLDLAVTIAELYPDLAQVMHQLRLAVSQKEELVGLLNQRSDREAREQANQQRLREQTEDALLSGKPFSQPAFSHILNETLYENIDEDDHLQTNLMELKKARRYLRYCGLDPALADSSWDISSTSDSASGTRARPAESKLEGSIADQSVSNCLEESLSRRPAVSALSQDTSNPTGSCVEPVQRYTLRQNRPTPAHALIAQHSPAAPLSKVPSQSYRVVPNGHRSDLRVGYIAPTLLPQLSLSAVQEQLNSFTGVSGRAVNNGLSNASGTSSGLSNPQEKQSLRTRSHTLGPEDLPTTRKIDKS